MKHLVRALAIATLAVGLMATLYAGGPKRIQQWVISGEEVAPGIYLAARAVPILTHPDELGGRFRHADTKRQYQAALMSLGAGGPLMDVDAPTSCEPGEPCPDGSCLTMFNTGPPVGPYCRDACIDCYRVPR